MRPKLSVRKAAELAQISEGRWRQIAKGYNQATRDTALPTIAPADTLARMAQVVGATPEQLREVGREDAADELVLMEAQGKPGLIAQQDKEGSASMTIHAGAAADGYVTAQAFVSDLMKMDSETRGRPAALRMHIVLEFLTAALNSTWTFVANNRNAEAIAALESARAAVVLLDQIQAHLLKNEDSNDLTPQATPAPSSTEAEGEKTGAGNPRDRSTDPEGQAADDARPNVWRERPDKVTPLKRPRKGRDFETNPIIEEPAAAYDPPGPTDAERETPGDEEYPDPEGPEGGA